MLSQKSPGQLLEVGQMGRTDNWWVFPGFEIEVVATGLDLPVNLAFVPDPGSNPGAPLLYVTELYGQVKVITNDRTVHTYASGLLNYPPDHQFPGSGESGVTGICVEPETGDLFLSMIYMENEEIKAKAVRTSSRTRLRMDTITTIVEGIPSTTRAHQIQAVTIGFDGKLYVNVAEGGESEKAQDDNDLRGKILRMNLDGTLPGDNPDPGSHVYAKGMRNPFGAAWRKSDRSLYVSINGPDRDDVIGRVKPGGNHGWPQTMRENAVFIWEFCQAPTAMAFMQDGQFPAEYDDHLFVALFGNSYARGRNVKGKKIVKMNIAPDGCDATSYDEFVTYVGDGAATPCGLAFGPGGLYFSDLHGDTNGTTGTPSGSIYHVKPKKKLATATLAGVSLAETEKYEIVQSYVYFPPDSVNRQYVTSLDTKSVNPLLGEATLYDVTAADKTIKNGAWSYPEPKEAGKRIKDYISFAYGEIQMQTERSG
ncbi:PQQ-dependent sugar dehydrogenase [Chloroflexota bacterium]